MRLCILDAICFQDVKVKGQTTIDEHVRVNCSSEAEQLTVLAAFLHTKSSTCCIWQILPCFPCGLCVYNTVSVTDWGWQSIFYITKSPGAMDASFNQASVFCWHVINSRAAYQHCTSCCLLHATFVYLCVQSRVLVCGPATLYWCGGREGWG